MGGGGGGRRTGSTAMMVQAGLCVRLMAVERPVTEPPVPAPATRTSSLREEGWAGVEGVEVMASMISGAVVCSWASGLLGCGWGWVGVERGREGGEVRVRCGIGRG